MTNNSRQCVIVVDALAEDDFHLSRDDFFLASALHSAFRLTRIHSSPTSLSVIQAAGFPNVSLRPTIMHSERAKRAFSSRVRYVCRTLGVRGIAAGDPVLFQSFYELAVVLFLLLNRRAKVFLIVTNNLSLLHGTWGRGWLKRRLLARALRGAAGIVVFTRHAIEQVRNLVPALNPEKIHRLPFHQAGVRRRVAPYSEREMLISYIGWARPSKGLDRFLDMVLRDAHGKFRYELRGTFNLTDKQLAMIAEAGGRLTVVRGYIPDDEYFDYFNRSMFVALPYGGEYAGNLSGILCDAISTGTPIIGSTIEPFVEYFERFGELGHLIDFNLTGVRQDIFVPPTPQTFAHYQKNLAAASRAHDFDSIANAYVKLLTSKSEHSPADLR